MLVTKIKKKTDWQKHLKAVTKKRNMDQNISDSKSHIWNSFLKILFRPYNVFIYVQTS